MGCEETFTTHEGVSSDVRFLCRYHTKAAPDEERFQRYQFDPDLKKARKPQGTNHIKRQGSDINIEE